MPIIANAVESVLAGQIGHGKNLLGVVQRRQCSVFYFQYLAVSGDFHLMLDAVCLTVDLVNGPSVLILRLRGLDFQTCDRFLPQLPSNDLSMCRANGTGVFACG